MLAFGFGASSLLLACGALAIPVVIHLIMRSKPRRVIFPALQFVQKTHKANLSKLRLKQFLLLAMRILAILLIAILLAQPFYQQPGSLVGSDEPASVVFVVDDSLSMDYRYQNQSLLARSRSQMLEMISLMPDGSDFAVLTTSNPSASVSFSQDRDYVGRLLDQITPQMSSRALAPAIAAGLKMLPQSPLAGKMICVVTDRTSHSWQDFQIGPWPEGVTLFVIDAAAGAGANQWLGRIDLSSQNAPVGGKVAVTSLLQSTGSGGTFQVQAQLDGEQPKQMVRQIGSGRQATTLGFDFQMSQAGVYHGKVWFKPVDAIEADNVRYFTCQAIEKPLVLLVRDPATIGRGDETTSVLSGTISAAGTARLQTVTPNQLTDALLAQGQIVLLAGVSGLSDEQWMRLERFVRAGGGLWVVPGALTTGQGYQSAAAVGVLPAGASAVESIGQPMGVRAKRFDHPLIKPFANDRNGGLDHLRFTRRLRLGANQSDVKVVMIYDDQAGALLTRRVGSGKVVFWNFSPDRAFSNLAEFPQQLILADRTLGWLASGVESPTQAQLGQSVQISVPPRLGGATATVSRPGQTGRKPIAIDPASRTVLVQADEVGQWTVEFSTSSGVVRRGFSVNLPPSESDLGRIDPEQIVSMFPAGVVRFGAEAGLGQASGASRLRDLSAWVLLLLLVVLVAEPFFANRFYRQQAPDSP